MLNILTVDVEDWYQAFNCITSCAKNSYEDRIEKNTEKILEILEEAKCTATFFVLGIVAEKHPLLIKQISKRGHEIASHGYTHNLVYTQSPHEFKEDLRNSIRLLEGISGEKVRGFRAPWFSITRNSFWALDILFEEGIEYDASLFPFKTGYYGIWARQSGIYQVKTLFGKKLTEVSISVIDLYGVRLPVTGGFYFRWIPYQITAAGVRVLNKKNQPGVFYFHPWELDTRQPRIRVPVLERVIHYTFLAGFERKLKLLLNEFKFTSIKEYLGKRNVS